MTDVDGPSAWLHRDDFDDRGILVGQVDDARVAVVAAADRLHAIGAWCTHYHGNSTEGSSTATVSEFVHSITPDTT